MTRYAELHCHTNYSFLDGAAWAGELVERAAELGYEALAITDHDGFRGSVQAHAHAVRIGLPLVHGTEVGMPQEDDAAAADDPVSDDGFPGPGSDDEDRGAGAIVVPVTGERDTTRRGRVRRMHGTKPCLLYTSDAADDRPRV